jgi:periplasmic protein TonB
MRYFAALLMFGLIGASPCANAQQGPFDAVATDAAAAIAKVAGKHKSDALVLVVDFVEPHRDLSVLGADLARQFFQSLQAHAKRFTFADRDEYLRQLAADKLTAEAYENPNTLKCYAPAHDAAFVVMGELSVLPDAIGVTLKTLRMKGATLIFERQVSLPITSAIQQLLTQRSEIAGASNSNRSEMVFPSHARVPNGSAKGYSMPACIYCPYTSFPQAAVAAKAQGTVILNVRVSAEGRPLELSLLRGLPCGLNDAAIETVSRWKFRPATGPDGLPAEAGVEVQVTFRLYQQ